MSYGIAKETEFKFKAKEGTITYIGDIKREVGSICMTNTNVRSSP